MLAHAASTTIPPSELPVPTPMPVLDWRHAHKRCQAVAKRAAALDREIARSLLDADRARVCVHLGYGSIIEYGERLFGFAPKSTLERLRVAAALESLPQLDQALAAGRLCYSAARELTRVAVAETEAEWQSAIAGKAVREIEELVSGHIPGDLPGEAARPEARRHVLRFEVAADVLALFRQAVSALRQAHGGPLDDEQALAMMARLALGGPGDDGRASHQILMTLCEQCGRGQQEARGLLVPVDANVVERAICDAQRIDANGAARQDVPPAVRRAVLRRDHGRCRAPGCRSATFLDVHHIHARADGGSHTQANLATLCGAHHDAIHRGALRVDGDADGTLHFRHADGTIYGGPPLATAQQQLADAFLGLKSMGWKEREARQALDAVKPHVGANEPIESVLRRCLAVLRIPTPLPPHRAAP